jgi:hypothetical protein
VRRLLIHCPEDLAGRWQANAVKQNRAAFELGVNLFVYATGKADLRNKTDSPFIFPPEGTGQTLPVARLEYPGNWDPEPGAWPRFTRYMWWETGITIVPTQTTPAKLKSGGFAIACLTGTTADRPPDDDVAPLRDFVANGGTLFIDCCGGSKAFAGTIRKNWLPAICPGASLNPMAEDDPILTGKISGLGSAANELPRVLLRPYTAQIVKPASTRLLEAKSGKGRVILSDLDVTTGLLGTNTWGITGYSPAYAQAILKNVLIDADAKGR